jgi:hypothetical protein
LVSVCYIVSCKAKAHPLDPAFENDLFGYISQLYFLSGTELLKPMIAERAFGFKMIYSYSVSRISYCVKTTAWALKWVRLGLKWVRL